MTIKVGDYVESLHGMVGVVKTVGKTVPVDGKEQFAFDWEITRPSIRTGNRGFFSGTESVLWLHYRRIGSYLNPFRKDRVKRKKIEPFELMKEGTEMCWKVTCKTDNTQTAEYGEHNVLVPDIPDNAELALKINEIISYLNSEGR